MGGLILWVYRVVCFFFLLHYSQVSCSNSTSSPKPCRHDQSLALLQFYQTLTIDGDGNYPSCGRIVYQRYNARSTLSWKEGSDCCSSWDGVTCDASTGDVIGLDLSCSQLNGTIHSNSSLFQLQHLQSLNLAYNDFNYSQIPSDGWSHLKSLNTLDLSHCSFSGSIPQSLGNLTQITHLNLSSNNFSGTIPHWLFTHLPSLQYLDLSSNDLVGPIPNHASGLQNLDLSFNSLNGTIPSWLFTHLPSLQYLDLKENDLTGHRSI